MKRLLACLLTAALCLLLPLPVGAEDAGLQFELLDRLLIVSGSGELTRNCWDADYSGVQSVLIQEGITGIQTGAFADFPTLTSVSLPHSCTRLAPGAFGSNAALQHILGIDNVQDFGYRCLSGTGYAAQNPFVISEGCLYYADGTDLNVPEGVTEIMPYAFGNLSDPQLQGERISLRLPSTVRVIRENAFAFCTPLSRIGLPDGLESVGDHAFYNCMHLQSLKLPHSVKSVGEQAFFNCRTMQTLTVTNPAATLGADACGRSYDWEQAVRSREGNYPGNYELALHTAMYNPCSLDTQLTRFALHTPNDRSYAEIGYSPELTVPFLMQTGTLRAYAGTAAEVFAAENGVPFEPLDILPGDVDLDGTVDILDVILLNKYLIGVAELTPPAMTAADADPDGMLTSTDSLAILKMIIYMN